MSNFDDAIKVIFANEGGLVDDPDDVGGITNKGISLNFLRSCDFKYDFNHDGVVDEKEIRDLTDEQAKLVYKNEFWDNQPYKLVFNQRISTYLFDSAVHMGAANANKCAQRATWCCDVSMSSIVEDGVLGYKTINKINELGLIILPALRAERANYYQSKVKDDPKKQKYLNGWLKRAYYT